jgi:protease I
MGKEIVREKRFRHMGRILLFPLFVLFLFITAGICKSNENEEEEMATLSEKKIVMIIASNNFRDEELLKPRDVLSKMGASITIASSSLSIAKGMLGAQVKPDILIRDVNVDDYDAIVFIGGAGAHEYFTNATAHMIAKEAFSKGKILCAICIAPSTLANAGVLEGKKATCFSSEAANLKRKGANYTGKDVEIDGHIITGSGPSAAEKFGLAIAQALAQKG